MSYSELQNTKQLKADLSNLLAGGEAPVNIADKLRVSRSVIIGWSKGHYTPTEKMASVLLEKLHSSFPTEALEQYN